MCNQGNHEVMTHDRYTQLKCNQKNLKGVSDIVLQQLEDSSGRGEFDEETGLLNAFERVIDWIRDDEEVRKQFDWIDEV